MTTALKVSHVFGPFDASQPPSDPNPNRTGIPGTLKHRDVPARHAAAQKPSASGKPRMLQFSR